MADCPRRAGRDGELLFAPARDARTRACALDRPPSTGLGPLADEDLQLALYCCYELHYRGFAGVDERWEWEPSLLALRAGLEQRFEARAARRAGRAERPARARRRWTSRCARSPTPTTRPSLSRYIEREATLEQVLEFLVHRSAYQLKEADPHSWAIPRLSGPPKAALVEIQADEYGGGRPERIHAELFARAMDGARPRRGLRRLPRPDPRRDARDGQPDVAVRPAPPPARRDRRPPRAVRDDLVDPQPPLRQRRCAGSASAERRTEFFDEHVEADAVHENIAAVDLAGGLARQEPELGPDVLWGAARWSPSRPLGATLLDCWEAGAARCAPPTAAQLAA